MKKSGKKSKKLAWGTQICILMEKSENRTATRARTVQSTAGDTRLGNYNT